jgi:copper resistance protein B
LILAGLLLGVSTPAFAQDGHTGHAGHAGHAPQPAQPDPHAGHVMPPAQPDPHAGHAMPQAQPDPHAGHVIAGPTPPEIPTSADDVGRAGQTPPPPAAFSGPAHAADAIFGTEAMAASRAQVLAETGAMRTTAFILERLEAGFGDDDTTFVWDAQGWIGGDINRLTWKAEGEGVSGDGVDDIEVQALYSRAVRPFWDVQIGVRHDFADGDDTTHLVAGVQGVAPGWWEVDAALFLSSDGDLTARVEAEYDLRLTQRLILQPRVELDLSAADEPARGLSSGFTGAEAGLRLRYEIRREFAPYVGVEWHSALGGAADLARAAGHPVEETRFLIGLRAWY